MANCLRWVPGAQGCLLALRMKTSAGRVRLAPVSCLAKSLRLWIQRKITRMTREKWHKAPNFTSVRVYKRKDGNDSFYRILYGNFVFFGEGGVCRNCTSDRKVNMGEMASLNKTKIYIFVSINIHSSRLCTMFFWSPILDVQCIHSVSFWSEMYTTLMILAWEAISTNDSACPYFQWDAVADIMYASCVCK